MDPWDCVLNVEENAYNEGVEEGRLAAQSEGFMDEGKRAGFLRGYALGLELGFMDCAVKSMIDKSNSETTVVKRLDKRRIEVIERITAVPLANNNEFDFDNDLRELRGLYKQCACEVGAFLKHKTSVEESSAW